MKSITDIVSISSKYGKSKPNHNPEKSLVNKKKYDDEYVWYGSHMHR
jgi:hypothetical protein